MQKCTSMFIYLDLRFHTPTFEKKQQTVICHHAPANKNYKVTKRRHWTTSASCKQNYPTDPSGKFSWFAHNNMYLIVHTVVCIFYWHIDNQFKQLRTYIQCIYLGIFCIWCSSLIITHLTKNQIAFESISARPPKEDEWIRRLKCPYTVGKATVKLKYQ